MTRSRFAGRVAYVTGGGSGVGRATAALLASEGASVYAVDVNEKGWNETVAAIRASGGTADGGTCDVADGSSVGASIAAAVKAFGGLDVLVNAAGVGRSARFEEIDEEEWNRVVSVNLTGVFHTTKAAVAHLVKRPGGAIVNVGSIAAMRGQAYAAHYAASKAGMVNFTKSIALEFATRGLRANCLCPGGIRSPFVRNFTPREDFEKQLVAYYSPPIAHQLWAPEDMATQIAFLASEEAKMINGAVLVADGGILA